MNREEKKQLNARKLDIPGADIYLFRSVFLHPPSVNDILDNITFNSDEESKVVVCGKTHVIPRKQCAYGDPGTFYRFSGNKVNSRDWNPFLQNIREYLQNILEEKFNFVLVNYYEDGNKCIGYHSDDEKDLQDNGMIASLSFGATRDFLLKHKASKKVTKIPLPHNTLLVMAGDTQKNYLHSVPKRTRVSEGRVNMTFRQMK